MKRSEIDAALDELYTRVPKMIGCTGRCWISCGPLDMSARERSRLREAGYKITPVAQAAMRAETFWCEALTEDHRCGAYGIRPMVCRIWGAVEKMRCPYGCVPEGGWLSDAEAADLLLEAEQLGGNGLPLKHPGEQAATALTHAERSGIKVRERYNVPVAFRPKTEEFPCPHCGFMLTRPADAVKTGRCAHCMRIVHLN